MAVAAAAVQGACDPGSTIEVVVLGGYWDGEPTEGVQVVFDDDAGTRTVVTDRSGHAVSTVSGEATVSVLRPVSLVVDPSDAAFDIVTVTGAHPGDELLFGTPDRTETSPPSTRTVYPPRLDDDHGQYAYRVYGSCSTAAAEDGPGTAKLLVIDEPCRGGVFDIGVDALDGGRVKASMIMPGLRVDAGGGISIEGRWMAPVELHLTYSQAPVGDVVFSAVGAFFGGARIRSDQEDARCEPGSTTCELSARFAAFADAAAVETQMYADGDMAGALQWQRTIIQPSAGRSQVVDLRPMPWVTDVRFDPASARVSWNTSGPADADAIAVTLMVGALSGPRRPWLLTAEPDAGELRLPPWWPAHAQTQVQSVVLIDRDDVPGYEHFRRTAESTILDRGDLVGARATRGAP